MLSQWSRACRNSETLLNGYELSPTETNESARTQSPDAFVRVLQLGARFFDAALETKHGSDGSRVVDDHLRVLSTLPVIRAELTGKLK